MAEAKPEAARAAAASPTSRFDADAYALRSGTEGGLAGLEERLAKAAPWYARFLRPWLPEDCSSPMLDVPCGAGNLLFALHRLGFTALHGVDGDEGQIALARQLGLPAEARDAFAAVEGAAPGSLARIFSLDFLEHIPKEEAVRFCRAARLALAPGGLLLCRTPSADGPFGSHDRYNDLTHQWALTSGSAVQLFSLAGFAPSSVTVRGEPPVPYNFVNALRLGLYRATTAAVGGWLHLCGIGRPDIWTRSMWIIARVEPAAAASARAASSRD